MLLIFLVLLCVFMFLVPRCDIRYDFRIKIMVSLSLPSVVYRMAHVSFTLFVFCFRRVVFNTNCVVVFVLFVLYRPMLLVYMDCPVLIAPSVFSGLSSLDFPPSVSSNVY